MFHEPRLLKNKGDCTFWELLYDRLVTLTAIEKCWVLSFKDISTFLSSTGAEVRHVIPSSHFIAVHLICVSHLEVQVKLILIIAVLRQFFLLITLENLHILIPDMR